jgi:hypothetical protein
MKGFAIQILRTIGAIVLIGLLVLAAFGIRAHFGPQQHVATQARSLGPTISQLERIGELASARIHVTDILLADGEGFRGAWLIKGDALLTCDVSRAKILNLDPTARTATLRLPPLRVTSARVDLTKTKTWSVEKKSWLPWTAGNQSVFRDAAMHHAQQLIEATASSSQHREPSKAQAELLIGRTYELMGWKVSIEWE